MTTGQINHNGFQRRLDVVDSILKSYGLKSLSVTPVEYEETCPYPYNNFIYKIQLSSPITLSTFRDYKDPRPGTYIPLGSAVSDTLLIRLSNPYADGLNNVHRVENEVATQHLFRRHLRELYPQWAHIIPAIYAWEPSRYPEVSDETGFGWTICEFMPGANLDAQFADMDLPDKFVVLEQVAEILAALQQTPLPQHLNGHLGGIIFDSSGDVTGGQTSILPPGPWRSYTDMWLSRFRQQIHGAEKSSVLKGWKEGDAGNRISDRISNLINANSIGKLVEGIDISKRVLVHGDFTLNNMLFDKSTKRVTALLDFDFSWVAHPVHEFITGLWDIGGGLHFDDDKLHTAVLESRFGDLSDEAMSSDDRIKWKVAKAWDSALAARGVIRPSTIEGIRQVERLIALESALCPSQLSHPVRIERLKRSSPEKLAEIIKAATDKLGKLLDELNQ